MRLNLRSAEPAEPSGDTFVTAFVKGREQYIAIFRDNQRQDVLRTLGLWAANPDLSFTWYDAARFANAVRGTK